MSHNNKEKKAQSAALMRPDLPFSNFETTPFTMMRQFMNDMDKMFKEFGGFRPPFFATDMAFPRWKDLENNTWFPKIEVLRHDNDVTIRADLPGMKREDITVEITDGALALSGERKKEFEETEEGFYRSEVSYGSFYRSIPLPKGIQPEDTTAHFDNGVLEIKVAIPAEAITGHKIDIKAGAAEPKTVAAGAA